MKNNEMMQITLTRKQVIDIRMAILNVVFEARADARNEELSDFARESATKTADHWMALREIITQQFREQDQEA